MNREIKFRAKPHGEKDFVYGYYFYSFSWGAHFINVSQKTEDGEIDYDCEINYWTLGQFTGLHDKNGKEVYEGDLLKGASNEINFYEVFHDGFNFCLRYKLSTGELYTWGLISRTTEIPRFQNSIEVIGDIFGNPELLK